MRRILLPTALATAILLGNGAVPPWSSDRPALVAAAAAQDYGYDDSAYLQFHDAMAPFGHWVITARWGHVWFPVGMRRGWRPYSDGHWAYTDQYGWTWVSDYEWGWAPFHYGRWAFDDDYGWVWVPGRVWGPAWVSFRAGDGYIGWAPLPPAPPGYGDDYGSYYQPPVHPGWWCFVRLEQFDAPVIAPQLVLVQQNVSIIHVTQNITNIKVINNYGVNRSFDDRYVQRWTHRQVPHYRPTEVSASDWRRGPRLQGDRLIVDRPPDDRRDGRQHGGDDQAGRGNGRPRPGNPDDAGSPGAQPWRNGLDQRQYSRDGQGRPVDQRQQQWQAQQPWQQQDGAGQPPAQQPRNSDRRQGFDRRQQPAQEPPPWQGQDHARPQRDQSRQQQQDQAQQVQQRRRQQWQQQDQAGLQQDQWRRPQQPQWQPQGGGWQQNQPHRQQLRQQDQASQQLQRQQQWQPPPGQQRNQQPGSDARFPARNNAPPPQDQARARQGTSCGQPGSPC
jgi:hypothetical protein